MLEIFLILIGVVIPLGMAKHKRSRRRSNFVAIPFSVSLALSTLADNAVLTAALMSAQTEDLYVISVDASYALQEVTAGEGPLEVGFSHSAYSVAQIAENLIAQQTGPGDVIAVEQSRRMVRRTGKFSGLSTHEVLADGRKIRTKCKFAITGSNNLDLWVQNQSDAALTTGAVVDVSGTIYGRWII